MDHSGRYIGRYQIVGRLGRGGMSSVYKARAPITNRLVALKILQPRDDIFEDLVGKKRLREMFIEEARIMGGLSHGHVAKILDCDEHDGQPFTVMEYFAHSIGAFIGESYKVESPSRMISGAKTRSYILQTLEGLERLHFAGIIHRDIKPYNLMITSDDRIKIIDFGFSRVRGEEKMAIPGIQVGSPYYAAPEQEKNPRTVDGRADIYSLGVLAYRMLTGLLFDYRAPDIPLPSAINGEVDGQWDEFIFRAIARNPDDRFASCQKMRLAAEKLSCPDWPQTKKRADQFLVRTTAPARVRSEGRRVMYKDVRTVLDLDVLLHPLFYTVPQFRIVSPMVAHERTTDLYWQRRGSGFTLDWRQAQEYIDYLNAGSWEGRDSWRLPTMDELRTILSPPFHGAPSSSWPLFDHTVHWLWSCDYCTKKQAWMVDVVESFFERLDRDGVASVCAVSSGTAGA
ncbi:protein kinase domain-containing protein [Desulforhopalus singaporensis]|uniref:Serine/threonine protein kinase n=1 Tax=Desulforhopalus singaporensis TaxID=91360 RepID=A0A1H0K2V2_9BACT|nr:protein kinase [Desulforhopalus singaporensis]SDO50236.1 serine/threonine protein kinase [Desulforhopalus singaporensis]